MLSSVLKKYSLTLLTFTRTPLQIAFFQLITLTRHPQCSHLPALLLTAESCSTPSPRPVDYTHPLPVLLSSPMACCQYPHAGYKVSAPVPPGAPCSANLYQPPSNYSLGLPSARNPAQRLMGTVTLHTTRYAQKGHIFAQDVCSPITAAG